MSLRNLNPISAADLPDTVATDAEFKAADKAHIDAVDPHLQYATQERGDARYVRKHGQTFKAALSAPQDIPVNIITKINFDAIISNAGNQFSNSRLTALDATENWSITTYILFEVASARRTILYLYKNGLLLKRLMDVTCPANYFGVNITPSNIPLMAGDYLELYARFFVGAAKVYGDPSFEGCWWEGSRVG